jgi:hypothetical protein
MKNTTDTIWVKALSYDEEGQVTGGLNLYWTQGARVVMYNTWEYTASGNIYSPVSPDPIGEVSLLEYFMESWTKGEVEYYLEDVVQNYC